MPIPSPVAVIAAFAVAGGVAALVGILILGTRSRGSAVGAPENAEAARSPRRSGRDRLLRLAPKGYLAGLERQLVLAGRPARWSVERMILAKPLLVAAATAPALLWVVAEPALWRTLAAVALLALAFFVPDLLIRSRAQERRQRIQLALPDTLDQMTISVEAGLGFEAAMAKVGGAGRGPLAEELIRTLQDMSIGRTRRDAYEALGARTGSADLRRFARSIIQADAYGIAVADVLRVQAAEMRLKRRQRAEEKAMKVPVKVIFPLVFCILPVLFIVLLTPAVVSAVRTFF